METTVWFEVLVYSLVMALSIPHYMWYRKMSNMVQGKHKVGSANLKNWKLRHAYLALAAALTFYVLFGGFDNSIVLKVLLWMSVLGWAIQIPSSFFVYKKLAEQGRLDVGDYEIYVPNDLITSVLRKASPGIYGD